MHYSNSAVQTHHTPTEETSLALIFLTREYTLSSFPLLTISQIVEILSHIWSNHKLNIQEVKLVIKHSIRVL